MFDNLPPGVTDSMLPGNRPQDVFAEQVEDALERHLRLAIERGDLPEWTSIDDLRGDAEDVKYEFADDPTLSAEEIAEETLSRYQDRKEAEEDEERAERAAAELDRAS